jgi:uncharacterized protein YjbJ (UPF0337 family)
MGDPRLHHLSLRMIALGVWSLACLHAESRITAKDHDQRIQNQKRQGKTMKPSTQDQIKGAIEEMKGTAKEKAGQVTNNPKLEAEGQDQKLAGKVQKKVGQIEKVFEK